VELLLLKLELMDRDRAAAKQPADATLGDEEDSRFGHAHSDVIPRGYRQRKDALADALEIYSDLRRLFLLTWLSGSGLPGICLLLPLSRSPPLPLFLLISDLLFVAFSRERRRLALLQYDDVNAARRLMREGGHIQPAGGRAGVGAGGEVQVFAVLVEVGEARVAERVGALRILA